ncbi:Imm44 family immunity protein [Aliamphritea hakodatensis]|uniref:Imm44 family immunity protein n=1 Tax=Aliamphritea hakodatensis TaxID=2895352 RepID=UPI0022FD609D|nr:Imm44 family immunity protein [Aliamphritea hakodatensis]
MTDELTEEPRNTGLDSKFIGAGHTTGRLLLFAELTPIIAPPALPVNLIIYIEAMRISVSKSKPNAPKTANLTKRNREEYKTEPEIQARILLINAVLKKSKDMSHSSTRQRSTLLCLCTRPTGQNPFSGPATQKGFDMKFFLSGEIDASHPHDLIDKKFQTASAFVTEKLTPVLEATDYGSEVLELNIIPIIMKLPPSMENAGWFKERKLFQRKQKSTDFRLRIDYDAFCNGDDKLRVRLIFDNIIQSVRILKSRTSKHFQGAQLEKDITECFNQNIQSV